VVEVDKEKEILIDFFSNQNRIFINPNLKITDLPEPYAGLENR
jgi:hypothetical protein